MSSRSAGPQIVARERLPYPPKWWFDSFMQVTQLRMNKEGALLLFDALKSHADKTQDRDIINMLADLERALYDAGVFGVRRDYENASQNKESLNGG